VDSSPAVTILSGLVRDEECHVRRKEDQLNKQPPWWKKLWGWSGFGEKKLWDWLQLLSALAIPIVLAVAGFWFAAQQQQQQRKIEDQRAAHEREIQEQQAQDIALQAYLSQMGQLILEEDLRDPEEVSEKVRTLARVRTITVLSRMDPTRKHSVMQFLIEADLVRGVNQGGECCKDPIIPLDGASLRDVSFRYASLEGASLLNANLRGANLRDADLAGADLLNADLSGANLRGAALRDADLSGANLADANLSGANLTGASLSDAGLSDAHLVGTYLDSAYLDGANLSGAGLSDAGLSDAVLSDAHLVGADLSDADLSGADLSGADLSGAEGITKERLEAQAKTVEGATMPDGQKIPSQPQPVEWGRPIPAGEHTIDALEPSFRLKVGKGWIASEPDTPPGLIENPTPVAGEMLFASPLHVFDPSNPSEPKELPAPDNADEWASWFQGHQNLETSKPSPVSVGGASGMRIDVTLSSTPENYPRHLCREEPCVPLYQGIGSYADWKDRYIIVDVEGDTVVIDVSAPASKFEEFLPKAQKVLDTVDWEGA
jgi:uncharacterized protein YjbI with pentapeptide repeats